MTEAGNRGPWISAAEISVYGERIPVEPSGSGAGPTGTGGTGAEGTGSGGTGTGDTGAGGSEAGGMSGNPTNTMAGDGNAGPSTMPTYTGTSPSASDIANLTSHCSQEVLNLVPQDMIEAFASGEINYYSGTSDYYFARFCPTCAIVKVYTEHDTYVYVPCPVCPAVEQQCPGKTPPTDGTTGAPNLKGSTQPAEAGSYNYQAPVCPVCSAVTSLPQIPLTTITVYSQLITCPTAAASSLSSLGRTSGAEACSSAAAVAVENAQVAAVTVTAPAGSTATATVVNVPCSSCPAGSKAVAVPQVAPNTGGPAAPAETGSGMGSAGATTPEGANKMTDMGTNVGGSINNASELGASAGNGNLSGVAGAANASYNQGVVQALKSGELFFLPLCFWVLLWM